MKSDFIFTYASLNDSEKAAFSKYIKYFYDSQKTLIDVFDHVAANGDIAFLTTHSHRNALNALSDLKRLIIEFLTVTEIRTSNSYDVQFVTLEALRKRQLNDLLDKKTRQLTEALNEKDSTDIWNKFLMLRLKYIDYFESSGDKLKENQGQKIQSLMTELDDFFLILKLKLSIEVENRREIRQENYEPMLLNDTLNLLEKELVKTDNTIHPLIKNLYLPLYKLTKLKSVSAYTELKTFIINDPTIEHKEKQDALLCLLNFAAFQVRNDDTYYQEYFDLAQMGIQNELFIAAGYFSIDTLSNLINVCCYLKEYTRAREFINLFSSHLDPEDKPIINLALARLDFEQGFFQNAIDLLSVIEGHKNVHYSIQMRVLLARAYYEQKTIESSQNANVEAAEVFMNRNKMSTSLKEEVTNFIKIMRFLINYKVKKQTVKSQMLKIDTLLKDKEKPIAFRAWLEQKFDALKKT